MYQYDGHHLEGGAVKVKLFRYLHRIEETNGFDGKNGISVLFSNPL